jgi:hypothetical protein
MLEDIVSIEWKDDEWDFKSGSEFELRLFWERS